MIRLDDRRPPDDPSRFRQRSDEQWSSPGHARLKETLGRFERQAHLPGHNHEERLGRIVLPQDHLARRNVRIRGVRGERIDVFGRECFEKRRFPNEFCGRFHQAPALRHPARGCGPNENIARLFEPIGEGRGDPLEQQIAETRLRLYQLHYDFARQPQHLAFLFASAVTV